MLHTIVLEYYSGVTNSLKEIKVLKSHAMREFSKLHDATYVSTKCIM